MLPFPLSAVVFYEYLLSGWTSGVFKLSIFVSCRAGQQILSSPNGSAVGVSVEMGNKPVWLTHLARDPTKLTGIIGQSLRARGCQIRNILHVNVRLYKSGMWPRSSPNCPNSYFYTETSTMKNYTPVKYNKKTDHQQQLSLSSSSQQLKQLKQSQPSHPQSSQQLQSPQKSQPSSQQLQQSSSSPPCDGIAGET